MTIDINTDKTLNGEKRNCGFQSSKIAEALQRFESHIIRIEMHLKDESERKNGFNDV